MFYLKTRSECCDTLSVNQDTTELDFSFIADYPLNEVN